VYQCHHQLSNRYRNVAMHAWSIIDHWFAYLYIGASQTQHAILLYISAGIYAPLFHKDRARSR
jgi:hypothetical protein